MTDKPKTFEEWRKGKMVDAIGEAYDAWHARDAELAEKDRRIAELEEQVALLKAPIEATDEEFDIWITLKKQNFALEARIAAGMALAKRMEQAGMVYWTNEFRSALKGES